MTDTPTKMTMHDAIERVGMGPFQYRLILAGGLNSAADAMEVVLLTFLSLLVEAEWNLTDQQSSSLISIVFIGALFGTITLGSLADEFGRKPLFVGSSLVVAICGVASAFSPNYTTLMILRAGVGVGVGGIVVPFSIVAENIPNKPRGNALLCVSFFWVFGFMAVPLVAYYCIEKADSWRLLLIACSIPVMISTVMALIFVPESARWLLSKGREAEALETLRNAAVLNKKDPKEVFPDGTKLTAEENTAEKKYAISKLLMPKYRFLTLCLWATWLGKSFLYWGGTQLTTLVFSDAADEEGQKSYEFDYKAIFWSSSSELSGQVLAIVGIRYVGRVPLLVVVYLAGGFCTTALCFVAANGDPNNRTSLLTLSFFGRTFLKSASALTWLITSEVLPTEIRNTGHSVANGIARIGGALSPYIVSRKMSYESIGITFGIVGLVSSFMASNIPETHGKALGEAGSFSDDSTTREDEEGKVILRIESKGSPSSKDENSA